MKSQHSLESDLITLPRLNLHGRQLFDLEMLLVDGFSPLEGFMNQDDYEHVLDSMRLKNGKIFPIPVVLDVKSDFEYGKGDRIILCDRFGNPLAIMDITSRFVPDKTKEILKVYGTEITVHPGVHYVTQEMYPEYIGGKVTKISLPSHSDFKQFRHTPEELKKYFKKNGWDKVIGFQTRNPMHRVHFELVKLANVKTGFPVLVHPVVGMTKPGDIDYMTRVRTYNIICNTYGKDFTYLSLLPLAMRMAGPREALWHALIRKNYGCTHFIVGRDHAGPGKDDVGKDFYGLDDARLLAEKHADEIGIEIIPSEEVVYSKTRSKYILVSGLKENEEIETISGTEFRRLLREKEEIPDWFSFKESISILRENVRRDARSGVAMLFTGLSGAGKSTIAQLLLARLQEVQDRNITFLDGDIIRENLTKGLGFSKEDRDTNIKRVGFVASEVVKHGGIAICALIAPYRETRQYFRTMVEYTGEFIEIHIATSLEECERRDAKGLYKKARKGLIPEFTGVSDPYEEPEHAELVLQTEEHTPEELVDQIIDYLYSHGIIRSED